MTELVVAGKLREPLLPLHNITLMEIFIVSAQFINIVPAQCVPQPIDTKIVPKIVSQGQQIIVDPLFPVRR